MMILIKARDRAFPKFYRKAGYKVIKFKELELEG